LARATVKEDGRHVPLQLGWARGTGDGEAGRAVREILLAVGENPDRDGLRDIYTSVLIESPDRGVRRHR
jgi:hypothetical protein